MLGEGLFRLAGSEKPFGLTLALRFFDRCGKRAPPASATGSGGALSHWQREAAILLKEKALWAVGERPLRRGRGS